MIALLKKGGKVTVWMRKKKGCINKFPVTTAPVPDGLHNRAGRFQAATENLNRSIN